MSSEPLHHVEKGGWGLEQDIEKYCRPEASQPQETLKIQTHRSSPTLDSSSDMTATPPYPRPSAPTPPASASSEESMRSRLQAQPQGTRMTYSAAAAARSPPFPDSSAFVSRGRQPLPEDRNLSPRVSDCVGPSRPSRHRARAKSADFARRVVDQPPAYYERSVAVARKLWSEGKKEDEDKTYTTVSEDGTDPLGKDTEESEFDDEYPVEDVEPVEAFEELGHAEADGEEAVEMYNDGRGFWVSSEHGYYVPETYPYTNYEYATVEATTESGEPSTPGVVSHEDHGSFYAESESEVQGVASHDDDEASRKGLPQACLFVASLSSARTDEQLLKSVTEHFAQWGPLANVKVLKDWMGRPYAFVQFENVEDAKRALVEAHNTVVDSRHIRVEQARVNRTLFIAKFNRTQPEAVREVLEKYGPVEDVTLLKNYQTGRSKGCGFVKYCFREDAIKAFLGLRQLRWVVEWAANLDRGNIEVDLRSIFVGQLNQNLITQQLLEERFGVYGAVESIQLVNKFPYDTRPAFAFIKYTDEACAERAVMEENAKQWLDRTIRVQYKETGDIRATTGHMRATGGGSGAQGFGGHGGGGGFGRGSATTSPSSTIPSSAQDVQYYGKSFEANQEYSRRRTRVASYPDYPPPTMSMGYAPQGYIPYDPYYMYAPPQMRPMLAQQGLMTQTSEGQIPPSPLPQQPSPFQNPPGPSQGYICTPRGLSPYAPSWQGVPSTSTCTPLSTSPNNGGQSTPTYDGYNSVGGFCAVPAQNNGMPMLRYQPNSGAPPAPPPMQSTAVYATVPPRQPPHMIMRPVNVGGFMPFQTGN
ncbi:hypothetical protein BC829DRAFT_448141 [Chytridium lagenaria]|nr:hypothetical protein BC829DRAFT_448141 [Chytridium lagenaria]